MVQWRLTYEQYYEVKVDRRVTRYIKPESPRRRLNSDLESSQIGAGYPGRRYAADPASWLRVNYSFGTPLRRNSDYRNVGAPSNTTNRRAFVDRNYAISSWRIGAGQ
ncbi:hypothetical protein KCP77_14045 [Salmonella enterica subsp. enterica]|nr:hypothetical protein KCP77_14045 [Salmonella enterica subsp. enterica]